MAPDHDLDALFKRLHLANARRVWRDLVQRAEREHWSYGDFLTLLVTEEIAHRQQTRLGRLTRRAHFLFLKTIDDFNFTYQSTLRLHMLGSALAADFVTEGRSLIFSGKSGRGKTHLACCQRTASPAPTHDLYDEQGAEAWGRELHDDDLGQAIIDRVLERGRLIRLDGPSIRTLHLKLDDALKDESDQDDEVARISGIKWPEFPEPTLALPHCPQHAAQSWTAQW